jgi:hypothetical protein
VYVLETCGRQERTARPAGSCKSCLALDALVGVPRMTNEHAGGPAPSLVDFLSLRSAAPSQRIARSRNDSFLRGLGGSYMSALPSRWPRNSSNWSYLRSAMRGFTCSTAGQGDPRRIFRPALSAPPTQPARRQGERAAGKDRGSAAWSDHVSPMESKTCASFIPASSGRSSQRPPGRRMPVEPRLASRFSTRVSARPPGLLDPLAGKHNFGTELQADLDPISRVRTLCLSN